MTSEQSFDAEGENEEGTDYIYAEYGSISYINPSALTDDAAVLMIENVVWKMTRGKTEGVLIGWDESRCSFFVRNLEHVPEELLAVPWDGTVDDIISPNGNPEHMKEDKNADEHKETDKREN